MRAVMLAAVLILVGCTGPNTDVRAVQLNGDTERLPENYLETVSRALKDRRPANDGGFMVSEPMRFVGASVFDPQRWYVCVRGLETLETPTNQLPPVWTLAEQAAVPDSRPRGIFELIIMFRRHGLSGVDVQETFDSAMCRNSEYRPLPTD